MVNNSTNINKTNNYSLCNKVCQVTCAGQWLTLATLVSFTNKTDPHDITEILLKVTFNTVKSNQLTNNYHPPQMIEHKNKHDIYQ
jgi:hypothetical protein